MTAASDHPIVSRLFDDGAAVSPSSFSTIYAAQCLVVTVSRKHQHHNAHILTGRRKSPQSSKAIEDAADHHVATDVMAKIETLLVASDGRRKGEMMMSRIEQSRSEATKISTNLGRGHVRLVFVHLDAQKPKGLENSRKRAGRRRMSRKEKTKGRHQLLRNSL